MKFGSLVALDGVDVSVKKGEILGMIGPNGSGKTTLFNVISGVFAPSSGEVLYKGRPITGMRPHAICRAGIARTFQVVQPFSRMTMMENVLVAAMHGGGLGMIEGRHKAEEILRLVGLGEKMHLTPGAVTTADRRRLELARALATDPEVVILDEIMAGLTPSEMQDALGLLKEVNRKGITIFMVEHIMKAVMTLCHRIIVLNYGRKISEGSPEQVAADPEVIRAYLGERYA
jgi:branched-chain amino acid transport system ATP-binding protein